MQEFFNENLRTIVWVLALLNLTSWVIVWGLISVAETTKGLAKTTHPKSDKSDTRIRELGAETADKGSSGDADTLRMALRTLMIDLRGLSPESLFAVGNTKVNGQKQLTVWRTITINKISVVLTGDPSETTELPQPADSTASPAPVEGSASAPAQSSSDSGASAPGASAASDKEGAK